MGTQRPPLAGHVDCEVMSSDHIAHDNEVPGLREHLANDCLGD